MSMRRTVLGIGLLLAGGSASMWQGQAFTSMGATGVLASPRGRASQRCHFERALRQQRAAAGLSSSPSQQILFGDLHVHTTFSTDAFLWSLPIFQGEGAHPVGDACDYARFCSALDFWSINDHAEYLETGRDSLYYVRAIQEPTPTINAGNLRCRRDETGACLEVEPCYGDYRTDVSDACAVPSEERAWSSPIFVDAG